MSDRVRPQTLFAAVFCMLAGGLAVLSFVTVRPAEAQGNSTTVILSKIIEVEANLMARINTLDATIQTRINTLDATLQARFDQIEQELAQASGDLANQISALDAYLSARLDGVDAQLFEIFDWVVVKPYDTKVTLCFTLEGGLGGSADVALSTGWGLGGFVGVDFFGNGAQLTVPPVIPLTPIPLPSGLEAALTAQLAGSANASMQFCFDIPIPRMNGMNPTQAQLAAAIEQGAIQLRSELVQLFEDVGVEAGNIQSKLQDGRNLLANFPPSGQNVLAMLNEGAGQVVDLFDLIPLNSTVKSQLLQYADLQVIPQNLQGLDLCSASVSNNVPAAFRPLLSELCSAQSTALSVRSAIQSTLNTVTNVQTATNLIQSGITWIRNRICSVPGISCD